MTGQINSTPSIAVNDALAELAPICARIAGIVGSDSETYLVGGVIRDACVGRPLLDIDIATADDPEVVAKSITGACGGSAFSLSDRFGCWRVHTRELGQVDIAPLAGGSIEHDVLCRDFTVNALAVSVHEAGQVIDHVGGVHDLNRNRIAMAGETAFDDDPLRLLRAVRFAHDLNFRIDTDTHAAIVRCAARANEPSGERIFHELSLLLALPGTRSAIRLLDTCGLVQSLLPELAACKGIVQSDYHHLDVYEHTLAVLDNVEDIALNTQHYLGSEVELSPDQHAYLRWAALLHDIAKPQTRTVDSETGRIRFIGHDRDGVPIVHDLCERWATSNTFRDAVATLVRTHLALGMTLHAPFTGREQYRFVHSLEPYAREAIILSLADRFATAGKKDHRRWVRMHTERAQQLWREATDRAVSGYPTPLLDGMQIAEIAGITPGPALGKLVAQLAEDQAIGVVTSVDEAMRMVSSYGVDGLS